MQTALLSRLPALICNNYDFSIKFMKSPHKIKEPHKNRPVWVTRSNRAINQTAILMRRSDGSARLLNARDFEDVREPTKEREAQSCEVNGHGSLVGDLLPNVG